MNYKKIRGAFTLTSGYNAENSKFVNTKTGKSVGADPWPCPWKGRKPYHIKGEGYLYRTFVGYVFATTKGGSNGWAKCSETLYCNPFIAEKTVFVSIDTANGVLAIKKIGSKNEMVELGVYLTPFGMMPVLATPFKGLRGFIYEVLVRNAKIKSPSEWTDFIRGISYNFDKGLMCKSGKITETKMSPVEVFSALFPEFDLSNLQQSSWNVQRHKRSTSDMIENAHCFETAHVGPYRVCVSFFGSKPTETSVHIKNMSEENAYSIADSLGLLTPNFTDLIADLTKRCEVARPGLIKRAELKRAAVYIPPTPTYARHSLHHENTSLQKIWKRYINGENFLGFYNNSVVVKTSKPYYLNNWRSITTINIIDYLFQTRHIKMVSQNNPNPQITANPFWVFYCIEKQKEYFCDEYTVEWSFMGPGIGMRAYDVYIGTQVQTPKEFTNGLVTPIHNLYNGSSELSNSQLMSLLAGEPFQFNHLEIPANNVEVRRELLALYPQALIEYFELSDVSADTHNNPILLYKQIKPFNGLMAENKKISEGGNRNRTVSISEDTFVMENATIVCVTCPSTGRIYYHAVPSDIAKAQEAVNWMFGLDGVNIKFTQES